MKLKSLFLILFCFLSMVSGILYCPVVFAQETQPVIYYEKALVLESKEVISDISGENNSGKGMKTYQEVKIRILSGKFKGQEKILENSLTTNPGDLEIEIGDKVIVYMEELAEGELSMQIHDYYRLPKLIWLFLIFLFLMVLIGRTNGLRAIISLIISIFLIFKVFIPLALQGINPVWLALAVSSVITVITLLAITGLQKKTLAAILGTIGGLISAVVLAIIFGNLSKLTGLSSEEARILAVSFSLDFKGLLFSGIIIAALGAVMDVAVSIASGIAEIKKASPEISRKKLIASGMQVGRDTIGTMSNTLIFAYVGASLFVLLLFTEFGDSYLKFFNFDFVAEEIIGAVCGSIGLILAVPITAFFAGYLESKK